MGRIIVAVFIEDFNGWDGSAVRVHEVQPGYAVAEVTQKTARNAADAAIDRWWGKTQRKD